MATTPIRLTQYSHGAGCGCKIEAATLHQILCQLSQTPPVEHLLVGLDHADDAAVFQISEHQALVFTTDFFTPIVDDPYLYGKIAAANALSDIYAMGGDPLLANAIVGFPVGKLSIDTVQNIMRGGADLCQQAGIPLAGGHTIDNPQPIFGLAALGTVRPDLLKTNATAKAGDVLVLTKPLGIGIMATGIKTGHLSRAGYAELIDTLTTLNSVGAWLGKQYGVHAMTDITGFGLAGHGLEMAKAAGVCFLIHTAEVPVMEEAWGLAMEGVVPSGAYRNIHGYGDSVEFADAWNVDQQLVFTDPQTNGGLLVSVAPDQAPTIIENLRELGCTRAVVVGEVTPHTGTDARMIFE